MSIRNVNNALEHLTGTHVGSHSGRDGVPIDVRVARAVRSLSALESTLIRGLAIYKQEHGRNA